MIPILARKNRGLVYLLRDDFNDTRASGSVNGTPSTPGPGTRLVTDTAGTKVSVGASVISISGSNTLTGDPGYAFSTTIARLAGTVLVCSLPSYNATAQAWIGINSNGNIHLNTMLGMYCGVGQLYARNHGVSIAVGSLTSGQAYKTAIVLRASGLFAFTKGGTQYTSWTLNWVETSGTSSPLYVGMSNYATGQVQTYDFIRFPISLWLPIPLASDSFNRANGVLGNTDGSGHAEANGGNGLAWTDKIGTWAISTNNATCSATSGSIGATTVYLGTGDAIISAELTRSAGNVGLILRYTDSSNYAYAYHDGTNVTMRQLVAGVDSAVVTAAAGTYVAGSAIIATVSGAAVRLYYNNVLIGTGTLNSALTATSFGMYTTDTGNSIDNFIAWARGTGGEYAILDKFIK